MKDCHTAEKDYQKVKQEREEEWNKNGKIKKREEEVGELEKVVVKVKTQLEIKRETIGGEECLVSGNKTERGAILFLLEGMVY